MKVSQAKHSWNRVANDWAGETSILEISVENSDMGFEQSSVALSSGAAVLVGVNSAGKSRLLKELFRATREPESRFARIVWAGESPAPFRYVDLFDLVERQFKFFRDNQYDDLLDQAGFTSLKAKEISEASFLLGRKYDLIEVAELDNTDSDPGSDSTFLYRPEIVPLFRATSYARQAESHELSRGEISVLTAIWIMKQADKSEILFWDEPDAFLSPASSGKLMTLIADWSNVRKRPTVMTSHSYLGLTTIPLEIQIMVKLNLRGVSRIETSNETTLWDTLRVTAPTKVVFIVEDRMAKTLLDRLLVEIGFPEYDCSEIWLGKDDDGVESASKFALKISPSPTRFVGVVDGDARARLGTNPFLISLPSIVSPENFALQLLESDPSFLGGSHNRVPALLETSTGMNYHDKFDFVATGLGRSPAQLLLDCWAPWLSTEAGREELERFGQACFKSVDLVWPTPDNSGPTDSGAELSSTPEAPQGDG